MTCVWNSAEFPGLEGSPWNFWRGVLSGFLMALFQLKNYQLKKQNRLVCKLGTVLLFFKFYSNI